MKLTEDQIEMINTSLKKIGLAYTDMRIEMTDHIASVLEEKEGDVEQNLTDYIALHKKKIRRQHTKLAMLTWVQSWKALGLNILTFRFLGIFSAVFLLAFALYLLMDISSLQILLFMAFCIANIYGSLPSVICIIKKKDQYSMGEGLSILNGFIVFPAIFSLRVVRESFTDTGILLYFAALIAISIVLGYTLKSFKAQIKLKYHG